MARALLRRALSLSSVGVRATPRLAAAFASSASVAHLRSPLDEHLLRLLRSEISYLAERRPPYPPPNTFKSFAVEDRPGEQWVRLHAVAGAKEEVNVDVTMFDDAEEPPPEDAPLFQRVESLERGPRRHISVIVEVIRGDRVLRFMCSAWPDELAVRYVITFMEDGDSGSCLRNFLKLDSAEREAVIRFLKDREVDEQLAGFLHEYMANKEKMELLRWLKTVESFIDK